MLGPLCLVLGRSGVNRALRWRCFLSCEWVDELALGTRERLQTVTLLRVLEGGTDQAHLLKNLGVDLPASLLCRQ